MFEISIIEDDTSACEVLKEYIKRYGRENSLDFEINCYGDALSFLDLYKHGSDIIFMDIELPNMNGIEAAQRLRENDSTAVLIFVTNMAQFAVKGYEVNALDFVVKPLTYPAFCMKIDRALKVVETLSPHRITVSIPGKVVRLDVRYLCYVEVMGHKLFYHTESEVFEGRGVMNSEEERLKKYNFLRCNSCYLVNPLQIKTVGKDAVVMRNDEVLQISHSKRKKFFADFAEYLGNNV